jgi:hypothetical protein
MAAENRTRLENGLAELPRAAADSCHPALMFTACPPMRFLPFSGSVPATSVCCCIAGRSRLRGLLEMHYAAREPVMGT